MYPGEEKDFSLELREVDRAPGNIKVTYIHGLEVLLVRASPTLLPKGSG